MPGFVLTDCRGLNSISKNYEMMQFTDLVIPVIVFLSCKLIHVLVFTLNRIDVSSARRPESRSRYYYFPEP